MHSLKVTAPVDVKTLYVFDVHCTTTKKHDALTLTSLAAPASADGTDDSAGADDSTDNAPGDSNEDSSLNEQAAIGAFEAATGKQQAVMLAWLIDPDPNRPMNSVHQLAGVSRGYAGRVLEQYEDTVAALGVEIEQGDSSLDTLAERAEIDHETALDEAALAASNHEQTASDDDSASASVAAGEGEASAEADADDDATADATAETEVETMRTGDVEADTDADSDSDAPVAGLAKTLAVLEDAARADMAGTPPSRRSTVPPSANCTRFASSRTVSIR